MMHRNCSVGPVMLALMMMWMTAAASAQPDSPPSPEDETLFMQAVSAYDGGQFREAADLFGRLRVAHPQSARITAALIMRAKALYWAGENMESAKAARDLLSLFPHSSYVSDAHLVVGLVYYRIGRSEEALQECRLAWDALPHPTPPRLLESLGAMVDTVAGHSLSSEGLARAIAQDGPRSFTARLIYNLAARHARSGNAAGARAALDTLLSTFPEQESEGRVMTLLAQVAMRSDVKLGILLPLMLKDPPSAPKQIAADVQDGITYALEKFANAGGRRVKVAGTARDTERDPVLASELVRELASDQSVVAILGPMFSSTTTTAAKAAQEEAIPLISPTANANGIAAIGPYVFQANPDYETRGRAMARYAVEKQGLRRLAILAPSDAYGKFLAEGFADEARRLGGVTVVTEWYERGKTNLTSQLRSIRRAGMRLGSDAYIAFGGKKKLGELMKLVSVGVPLKTLDSLLHRGAMVRASTLLGPDAATRLDSLGIAVVYNEAMVDSLDTPVTELQAIYVPISSPGEIGVIASQLVYYNIQAQLLGSGEWNDLSELDQHRRYCTGVVFESDSYVDTARGEYQEWAAGYAARFQRYPSKNSLMGYDVADMVLQIIGEGATTRQELVRSLAEARIRRGFHSPMGFSSRRVNNNLSILRFDGRNVSRIDEIRVE